MKIYIIALFSLFVIVIGCNNENTILSKNNTFVKEYPITFRDDSISDDFFGVNVADPYRWLEDENSDRTVDWVDRQISFTKEYLTQIPFRDSMKKRLSVLVDYEKFGTPFMKKGKYFIYKNSGLQNQSILYEVDSKGNNIKVIIDPNKFSTDGTKALGGISFDKEGKNLAYMVSSSGADWKTAYVINMETGKLLKDSVKWIKFSGLSWYKDGFFYSRYPNSQDDKVSSENTNHKLYYHKLGTDQKDDKIWYEDTDHPNRNIYASTTDDEKYLVLNKVESTSGNAFSYISLGESKSSEFEIIDDFESDFNLIENIDDKFLILTNKNSPNKQIILLDTKNSSQDNWKVLVPESKDPIKGAKIIGDKLFVSYLHNAYSLVKVYDLEGNFIKNFPLPGIGSVSGFSSEKDNPNGFFTFSSFLFPATVYSFDVNSLEYKLFKATSIDFNAEEYETEQVWFDSKDGTKIPMFLTYKKSIKKNSNNPVLLYGYGGFDISITPSFRASRLLLLEEGGILAIANIRGGGEFGEDWHQGGTLGNKQNVFDDFIAAAEYLIEKKFTSPKLIAIEGGSNGGLLVGACITQRPDLFGAAFPKVGVLDMLRYHKFTIGWAWATDYGKSDEEEAFNYLIKYSPVHNVKKNKYPATLVITADHDDRVVPAHSFKFISELQNNQIAKKPVLIRIEKKAGHGAGKPLSKVLDELADMYSFMFYNMGIEYK